MELVALRQYNRPFIMGGKTRGFMKTFVTIPKSEIVDLAKGFEGFVCNGMVFELESGGYVGDSLSAVIDDINSCDDISVMRGQVSQAIHDRETAQNVSSEEFFK